MKTRNKVLIGGVLMFIALVIGGYGLVSADGPWGGPCGDFSSRFQARRFHSETFHKDMVEFILWKMDKKAKEMNLTDPQKIKYEILKDSLKIHFTEFHDERQKMKERVRKELSKDNPDLPGLIEAAKTKVKEVSGVMNKNLDLFLDFYSSLDDRQKAMVGDEIKKRMRYNQS